jgi:MYXO-CTERM domain-containing protein
VTFGAPVDAIAADFDHDGKIDFASANGEGGTITFFLNRGAMVFAPSDIRTGHQVNDVTVADLDGDGVLDASEIGATQNVCNGLGSLVESSVLAPDPARCAAGGIAVRVGVDTDGSGTLSDAEVDHTSDICDGDGTLISVTPLTPDPTVCPTGGVEVKGGVDHDGDGVLDDSEVSNSENVCNGRSSLSRSSTLARDPALCPSGGTRVESGLDDDGDGVLADAEVDSSQVLCSGSGLAVRTTILTVGSMQCAAGGSLLETGIDTDGNGVLDDVEVQSTSPLCGAPSVLVETRQLTKHDGCENGGIRISSGHDDGQPEGTAGDGLLQPDEVETSQDLCQDDVLVSGGSGSCSAAPRSSKGSTGSLGLTVLAFAFALYRRRRKQAA